MRMALYKCPPYGFTDDLTQDFSPTKMYLSAHLKKNLLKVHQAFYTIK